MAVWQFPLMLVPEGAFTSEIEDDVSSFLGEDGWDLSELWIGNIDVSLARSAIEEHLGPGNINKLLPNAVFWGAERGNDVALFYENERVEEILIRMDMRLIDAKFANSITQIALDLSCKLLIMEQQIVVDPTIDQLERYAKQSRAAAEAYLYRNL